MRNTKKAFTLVELIVVITILAILATVAFVSLGGQTDNARNTVKKDSLGKLATSVENARTNGLALSAFLANTDNNLSTWNIAWTWVVALATAKHYGAWDINLTALDVKAADFKDWTHDFKYWYTSKMWGKYELDATVKEGDLEKAYVVGTYAPRLAPLSVLSGSVDSWDTKTFVLKNTTDIKKVGYGDYITANATAWNVTTKIIAVSPDYTKLTVKADITWATTIQLANPDVPGLVAWTWATTGPVTNDSETVPYHL